MKPGVLKMGKYTIVADTFFSHAVRKPEHLENYTVLQQIMSGAISRKVYKLDS